MDKTPLLPSSSTNCNGNVMYRTYKKRWYMLAVLTLINFSNGMVSWHVVIAQKIEL